jgi:hypothetical protein
MRTYTQKELLNEGFRDMVRAAGSALRTVGKAVAPKTAAAISSTGDAIKSFKTRAEGIKGQFVQQLDKLPQSIQDVKVKEFNKNVPEKNLHEVLFDARVKIDNEFVQLNNIKAEIAQTGDGVTDYDVLDIVHSDFSNKPTGYLKGIIYTRGKRASTKNKESKEPKSSSEAPMVVNNRKTTNQIAGEKQLKLNQAAALKQSKSLT